MGRRQWTLVVIRWLALAGTFVLVSINLRNAFLVTTATTTTTSNNENQSAMENDGITPSSSVSSVSSSSSSALPTTGTSSSVSSWKKNPHSPSKKNRHGQNTIFVQPPKLMVEDSIPTGLQRNESKKLFLVHVGKTGGETVRQTLEITCRMRANPINRKACFDSFRNNNNNNNNATTMSSTSPLSRHTIGAIHCGVSVPQSAMDQATTFLWTLRNPIQRVISWYRYTNPVNCRSGESSLSALHPQQRQYLGKEQQEQALAASQSVACHVNRSIASHRNKWATKFFTCFPTINEFALSLSSSLPTSMNDGTNTTITATSATTNSLTIINCSKVAWRTISGQAPNSNHLYYNHAYYWNQTMAHYPTKENWIIRTESLWEDIDTANDLLIQEQQQQQQASMTLLTEAKFLDKKHDNRTMEKDGPRPPPLSRTKQKQFWHNITHGSEAYSTDPRDTYLSPRAQQLLCCALVKEIDIYIRLIQSATNLLPHQKESTLLRLLEQCSHFKEGEKKRKEDLLDPSSWIRSQKRRDCPLIMSSQG